MKQQTYITLNFEEIFSPTDEITSYDPPSINQSNDLNSVNRSSSEPNTIQRPSSTLHRIYTSTSLSTSALEEKQLGHIGISSSVAPQNSNNSPLNKSQLLKRRTPKSTEIGEITQRLSITPKRYQYQKNNCTTTCEEQMLTQYKNTASPKKKIRDYSSQPCLQTFNSRDFNTFERLHYLGRVNELKNKYKCNFGSSSQIVETKSQMEKVKGAKKHYLKNYIPFYDRLQNQVNRSFEKVKIIQQGIPIAVGDHRTPFKPKLFPSQYSNFIKSRYKNSTRKEHHTKTIEQLERSSLNTSYSNLNKSAQLVSQVQEHFYRKMKCIFIDKDKQYVQVTETKISLLTDVQFQILNGFIMYLDENKVKAQQFLEYLVSYYNTLTTAQKGQLRTHQTRIKHKYSLLQHKSHLKSMATLQKTKNNTLKEQQTLRKPNNKYSGDYHVIIQHFI